MVTSGGAIYIVDMGRRRIGRVGDGDMSVGPGLGGRSPPMSASSLSLPLPSGSPSPVTAASCCLKTGLAVSLLTLVTLLPVGCGEMLLGPKILLGFALPTSFAICSKCERKEDTGF